MTASTAFRRTTTFKKGSGCYACRHCDRKTRDDGMRDSVHLGLCRQCFELAGFENQILDDGAVEEGSLPYIQGLISELKSKKDVREGVVAEFEKTFLAAVESDAPKFEAGLSPEGNPVDVLVVAPKKATGAKVNVDGKVYASVYAAFVELGLPVSKHQKFRAELKKAGHKVFILGDRSFAFAVL